MGFKNFIKKVLGIRSDVVTPLDSETIKRDEQLKAVLQQKTARDAQLAELLAEKHESKEEAKSEEKEQEFYKRLNQQEKEMKDKNTTKSFSFMKFFNHLKKNKKLKIEIVDRNDEEVLGIFGDLISYGDDLAILDIHGNIITKAKSIQHLIYKPETLGNQVKRNKISIPYIIGEDKQLHYVPDLENLEHSDIIYNERDKTYDLTEEKQNKLKYLLIDKDRIIRELRTDKERLENITIDLKNELDDNLSSNIILKNQVDNGQSRLSEAMGMTLQFETKVGELQRQITMLTELKAMNEMTVLKLQSINEQLLQKAEGLGVKSHFQREMGEVLDLIDWLKDKLPHTVINQLEQEKIQKPVQPGQLIGKTGGGALAPSS